MRIVPPQLSPRPVSTPSTPVSARPVASRSVLRDPEQAVAFTRDFNARLALPAPRLEEKEALLRTSASSFFRMMPALFHEDLRGSWREASRLLSRPAPTTPVVGDMHLGNLGTVREAQGEAVWGLNDFDQAATGSPEVDLTRLATSAVLTAREAGLDGKAQGKAVEALFQAYAGEVERLAAGGRNPGAFLSKKEARGGVDDLIAEAREASPTRMLEKYCRADARGQWRFRGDDSLRQVPEQTRASLRTALATYERNLSGADRVAQPLEVLDFAQRLDAGGSSYGLDRYYALVRARQPGQSPVLLEMKELLAPSLPRPAVPADGGAVVRQQTELGGARSPLTGATTVGGRAFLVRELEPEKAQLSEKALDEDKEVVSAFAQAGVVLARAHGGSRERAQALSTWLGDDTKDAGRKLGVFARAYADQVQADWGAFKRARVAPSS